MKRTVFYLFFALLLPILGTSCSDDEEFSGITDPELMYGEWVVTGYPAASHNAKIEFFIDKSTVTVYQDGEKVEMYTYEMSGDQKTLLLTGWWDDELAATAEILSLNGSTAKLRITDLLYGLGSYTVTLKKVE